jgi:hypothetical protein
MGPNGRSFIGPFCTGRTDRASTPSRPVRLARLFIAAVVEVLDAVPAAGGVHVGYHLALFKPGRKLDRRLAVPAHSVVAWFYETHDRPAHGQQRGYRRHPRYIGHFQGQPEWPFVPGSPLGKQTTSGK